MDGKLKSRITATVPNSLGRQIGVLPVGNPPVRPRRPKPSPSTSYKLPLSGRAKYSPPSPLVSGSQRSISKQLEHVDYSPVPSTRKQSGQQRLSPGSVKQDERPFSGAKGKERRPSSATSEIKTPKKFPAETEDDGDIFHPHKTVNPQEILDANHETDPENIYEVNLYGSELTKISNLQKFKKLRVLDLSCNYIPKIENLSENVDIRELKLYGNRIHQIESLTCLKELSNLQLQHNKIKTIGKSLHQCTKIKTLNLSSNHIMKIDSAELSCCSLLTVLDLSCNMIDTLSVVNYLPNLEELNASGNRLRTIDFSRCKKLQDIDLSNNDIRDLSGIKGMTHLHILNVSSNRITTLKPVGKLKSLTELYLADNHITELSYMSSSFPVLEILNVSRNEISSFDEVCTLSSLDEMSELYISGNPFSQDDGVHISYMTEVQSEFPNLDILDGAHLKRPTHKGAPLMRPMSASSVITVRQVESQMRQMDSEMKVMEDDITKRFEFLRSTLEKLPSQAPDSSRSPKSVSQSHNFVKSSSHSRIRDALKFAADNTDNMKN